MRLTVPPMARKVAAQLLSAMTSDSINGPPNTITLTQLIPESLAFSVKESVSNATVAGAGSAGAGTCAAAAAGSVLAVGHASD